MKVLVAEDDRTSRSILTAMLSKRGYSVTAAVDGVEALARLQEPGAPRLVILDWMMPGLDGLEVCRRLRAIPTNDPPYIVILTAMEETRDTVRGLEAGANDYITKPYEATELEARIGVGRRVLELQTALVHRVTELEAAIAHIKRLQGILPICMHCHKIRSDHESWQRVERYICEHSDAQFSHGICPDCMLKFYGLAPDGTSVTPPPSTEL